MKWVPLGKFSEIRQAEVSEAGVPVYDIPGEEGVEPLAVLQLGDRIRFTNWLGNEVRGAVVRIDYGSMRPLFIEHVVMREKRIEAHSPDDLYTFWKEPK